MLLPLFGVVQLKVVDYERRATLVWCMLAFALYTLFRWGTAYYHTAGSLALVFTCIPPNIVQYVSLSCTAIGAIVLNIGIVESLAAVLKLIIALLFTAVAVTVTHVSPTILTAAKNMFATTR